MNWEETGLQLLENKFEYNRSQLLLRNESFIGNWDGRAKQRGISFRMIRGQSIRWTSDDRPSHCSILVALDRLDQNSKRFKEIPNDLKWSEMIRNDPIRSDAI